MEALDPLEARGRVLEVTGCSVRATLGVARIGDEVELEIGGGRWLPAEVVAFRGREIVLLPCGETPGIASGSLVRTTGRRPAVGVGQALAGRVLDAMGRPIDGGPPLRGLEPWPLERAAPGPLQRGRTGAILETGVRAVDGLLALGAGQRVGIFAGPGTGKSMLLGQLARQTRADAVVVGLVGERSREVREFVERGLGREGLARCTVVAATSDEPALLRLRAALVATALAEWHAVVHGRQVLLLLDSLTRCARAQRDVGLAAGEPPVRQGYPPSVFALLPRLLERAGPRERGRVTALYTVLVAGGDHEEPIADELRGILDGHLVLDPRRAAQGHFPAIDPLRSLSRLMGEVAGPRHRAAAARVRGLLDAWERVRDLLALGAHVPGADREADAAVERIGAVEAFLRQGSDERADLAETVRALEELAR
ncbi:MAG: FliI/YscN family ATPase [Deltaproteobacteria bacterium]|nr:FliI/YscN family ATPase [Deltaproteobacteria bacterium]